MTQQLTEMDLLARAVETGFNKATNPLYNASSSEFVDFVMNDLPRILRAANAFLGLQTLMHSYSNQDETAYPVWAIVETGKCGEYSWKSGPYFSRESATDELEGRRYHWGGAAFVYAFSGCYSKDYKKLFDATKPHQDFRGKDHEK